MCKSLRATTVFDSGKFEVLGGDWDLSEVAISLAFNVVRVMDPTTCRDRTGYCDCYISLSP